MTSRRVPPSWRLAPGHFDRLRQVAVSLAHLGDPRLPDMHRLSNQEQGEPDHPCEQDHGGPFDDSFEWLAVLVGNGVRRAWKWRVVVVDLGQRLVHLAEPRAFQPLVIATARKAVLTHSVASFTAQCVATIYP